MTGDQWLKTSRRQIAQLKRYQALLAAQTRAWEQAMRDGLALSSSGDLDPYREAIRESQEMKQTRLAIEKLQARMRKHIVRMLPLWEPEGRPS